MRKFLSCLMFALLVPVSQADADDVGFSLGINVGAPAAVSPVYAPQPVVLQEPPEFVEPPELGFYVAVGVPYDLFFVGNLFYLFSGNAWYASPYYNGPWAPAYYNHIPYTLRRYPFERIHYYRDDYFRRYHHYGDWGGHRYFRPDWRRVDRGTHGWSRPAYNAPAGTGYGNRSRPVYNVPSRPVYNAPSRPVYNAPSRPVYNAPNKPVYNAPSRPDYGNRSRPEYNNNQTRPDQGSGNRPVYSAPGRPGNTAVSRPVNNTQSSTDRGNANGPVNHSPQRPDHGNRISEGRVR